MTWKAHQSKLLSQFAMQQALTNQIVYYCSEYSHKSKYPSADMTYPILLSIAIFRQGFPIEIFQGMNQKLTALPGFEWFVSHFRLLPVQVAQLDKDDK